MMGIYAIFAPLLNRKFHTFANFTPHEELIPKRHFVQICLKSVLKFHIFLFSMREQSVHIRLICAELVGFFSAVKN